jgi:hypothetical protein
MAVNGNANPNANPVYKLTDAAPENYAQREPTRRRVMVSIPSHSGQPSYITQSSFLRSRDLANSLGVTLDINVRVGDSSIERARDIMFSEFLDKYTDATDMMFIDDDIGWEAEGLMRLLAHQVDFVGGAYRSRGDPEVYVLRSRDNELQRQRNGLMDVEGVPTGFLRITRRAAEKLAEADKDNWYTDPTAPGLTIRHLFEFKVRDHRLYSEDYNFCRRWIALGEKCWIDPEQTLHHVGIKVFSGNLMRWLEGNAQKIPDHVPKGEAAAHFANPEQASVLDTAKALIA